MIDPFLPRLTRTGEGTMEMRHKAYSYCAGRHFPIELLGAKPRRTTVERIFCTVVVGPGRRQATGFCLRLHHLENPQADCVNTFV